MSSIFMPCQKSVHCHTSFMTNRLDWYHDVSKYCFPFEKLRDYMRYFCRLYMANIIIHLFIYTTNVIIALASDHEINWFDGHILVRSYGTTLAIDLEQVNSGNDKNLHIITGKILDLGGTNRHFQKARLTKNLPFWQPSSFAMLQCFFSLQTPPPLNYWQANCLLLHHDKKKAKGSAAPDLGKISRHALLQNK